MKRVLAALAGAPVLAGTLTLAGALIHAHQHKLRRRSVLLPHAQIHDVSSLRILHISDPHLLVTNKKRRAFIRDLASTDPDLVIVTGDLISHDEAIDAIIDDFGPLLSKPGAFVFGSNDYFAPQFKNPLAYLWRNTSHTEKSGEKDKKSETVDVKLNARKLRLRLSESGWLNMTNRRGQLEVRGWTINFVGVDDPHLGIDRMPPADPNRPTGPNVINIGLTHAPYTHVLDAMVTDGAHMIFAGHTHGGQVNLPIYGALVTNCDIDKHLANGMFAWPATGDDPIKGDGAIIGWDTDAEAPNSAIVHLSAGLGTSPYVPVRTFCSPEAIQIDVVPIAGEQ